MDNQPTDFDKAALTIMESARRSGLGRDGIYRAIREGKLEAKKFGRRTIIPLSAFTRFLDELPPLRL